MYYVIEFLMDNTVAVVPDTWMTSLDTCVWPPTTPEWKNKVSKLVKLKSKPEDCFVSYEVRVLGTSDLLKRAYEKARKADDTSDINTTDAGIRTDCGRRKRKTVKRKVYLSDSEFAISSEEEEENKISYIPPPQPPAVFQKKQAPVLQTPLPRQAQSQQAAVSGEGASYEQAGGQTPKRIIESTSMIQQPPLCLSFGMGTPSSSLGRPLSLEEVNTTGMGVETLLRLNAEFHKQILRKLKLLETEVASQREVLNRLAGSSSQPVPSRLPNLPFGLPLISEEALMAVEEFLKIEANQDIMIRHLKLVGGSELDSAIRGILGRCMTNGLASNFSYNGLRNKKQFKSLLLKKVVFSAVHLLYPEVTEAEFSKIAGDWFRYAPRKKGGNKERVGSRTAFTNGDSFPSVGGGGDDDDEEENVV